jgi:hypothetical protein
MRMMRRAVPALVVIALAAVLAACGGGGSEPSTAAPTIGIGGTATASATGSSSAAGSSSPAATASPAVFPISAGECLTAGTAQAFDWAATAVPCSTKHTVEVFGVLDVSSAFAGITYASVDGANGPQRDQFISLTQQACALKLSQFSGGAAFLPSDATGTASVVPYFYGSLAAEPVPAIVWDKGDERVACYATFGSPGNDEGTIPITGDFLKTFWTAPPTNSDARFCQNSAAATSVSCAQAHDREYLGQFFAQDYPTRAGFVPSTLTAFISATATAAQWAPYDALCQQLFAPVVASGGRSDIAIVATTDTTAAYWGLASSYAFQCVASPTASTYLKGSVIGIGSSPLATTPAPIPAAS